MTDLFWPGDERAGRLMSEHAFLDALVTVENAWLSAMVDSGQAPPGAAADLTGLITGDDLDAIATGAEAGGNPVIGLVSLLRSRTGEPTSTWLHRGLTSQDVVDTALVLCLADTLDGVVDELRSQVITLSILSERHAHDPMVGRTLTQHAVPTTFGAVVATWLDGVLDAADLAADARALLPAQLGGAVGTLAATTELAAHRGASEAPSAALQVVRTTATELGLRAHRPWHTSRAPITRAGDALTSCTDAWGHITTDVATLSRSEIAELAEPSGGGSSTMPGKRNPVLSVLVRRASLAMPGLAATLHTAAATSGDQRPDGSWHVEWATLAAMGRRTMVAASQTTELLQGLQVDVARMRSTLTGAAGVIGERHTMDDLVGAPVDDDPTTYLGATELIVAGAVARGRTFLEENA